MGHQVSIMIANVAFGPRNISWKTWGSRPCYIKLLAPTVLVLIAHNTQRVPNLSAPLRHIFNIQPQVHTEIAASYRLKTLVLVSRTPKTRGESAGDDISNTNTCGEQCLHFCEERSVMPSSSKALIHESRFSTVVWRLLTFLNLRPWSLWRRFSK